MKNVQQILKKNEPFIKNQERCLKKLKKTLWVFRRNIVVMETESKESNFSQVKIVWKPNGWRVKKLTIIFDAFKICES